MEYLYRFLINNTSIGPKGRLVPVEEVEPGDVIQLSFLPGQFSHSLIVVAAGGKSNQVLVATHSEDADNRDLWSYHFHAYRCLKISV